MKTPIDIVISKDGELAIAGYLNENELEKVKTFLDSIGYDPVVEQVNRGFKNQFNPLRKRNIRDINWSDYRVILKVIKLIRDDKSDDEITKALCSDGSGFSITVKRGILMSAYTKYIEENVNVTDEQLISFAKKIAKEFSGKSKNSVIVNQIEKLISKGCKVGENDYPECEAGFGRFCFKCAFNIECGKYIQTDDDISIFNKVLDEKFEDEK